MKQLVKGIAIGVVTIVAVFMVAWMVIAYGGVYDVSARQAHMDAVRWTLDTTMHRSIENRAEGVVVPENFTDQQISAGAGLYAQSCAHCHGTPGAEPEDWSRGMRPQPPHLTEAATEWSPQEIHWIVENGIRMTGMPAFGDNYTAEQLAAITAFVDELPGLTAEDYTSLTSGTEEPAPDEGGASEPDAQQPAE